MPKVLGEGAAIMANMWCAKQTHNDNKDDDDNNNNNNNKDDNNKYEDNSNKKKSLILSLMLHRASFRFTNYYTTNKCTNCMSFIFKSLFKTLSLLLHVSIAYRLSSSGSTYSS